MGYSTDFSGAIRVLPKVEPIRPRKSILACGPIHLIQDPDNDRSFLAWDNSEKAQTADKWLNYVKLLIAAGISWTALSGPRAKTMKTAGPFFTHNGKYLRAQGHLVPTWGVEFKQAVSDSETASGDIPL